MATFPARVIPEGERCGILVPLTIVYLDKRDIEGAGLSIDEAIHAVARSIPGPAGINVFDMEAVTTTSDGVMIEGAIIRMAASDGGRINPDFGMLSMAEIEDSDELLAAEPHLIQWRKRFPGRRLFRGPDPKTKLIPVHNVVITGRASNNNSATEMMNIVTMEEIILPILGQLTCMKGGPVLVGMVGEVISVGIGMTIAEQYGRVFPSRQFKPGETAHGSGAYAKTLKKNIPCVVCDKAVLAEQTIAALDCGCVPARELGCSPAVLSIARAMGYPMAIDRITAGAWEELESVGITRAWLEEHPAPMTREEVIAKADEIIPGVERARRVASSELLEMREIDG